MPFTSLEGFDVKESMYLPSFLIKKILFLTHLLFSISSSLLVCAITRRQYKSSVKETLACTFLKRTEKNENSPSKISEGIKIMTEIIQRLRS